MDISPSLVKMDRRMAELIGWAVSKALDAMVGVKADIGKFDVVDALTTKGDAYGIMNIKTDSLEGIFILAFPQKTIMHILDKVYGSTLKNKEHGIQDAVGEFTNVIYGLIKMGLNHRGLKIHMSLPSVVVGDPLQLMQSQKGPFLELPIQIDKQYPFQALFYLHETAPANTIKKTS